MNPLALTTALQRLVLAHHTHILSDDPKFIVCFDADGQMVPTEAVAAASPTQKHGQLDAFTPVPGVGHYAHLFRRQENVSREGTVTRYELNAPDWSAVVDVSQPVRGSVTTTATLNGVTAGTTRFFANYS